MHNMIQLNNKHSHNDLNTCTNVTSTRRTRVLPCLLIKVFIHSCASVTTATTTILCQIATATECPMTRSHHRPKRQLMYFSVTFQLLSS